MGSPKSNLEYLPGCHPDDYSHPIELELGSLALELFLQDKNPEPDRCQIISIARGWRYEDTHGEGAEDIVKAWLPWPEPQD